MSVMTWNDYDDYLESLADDIDVREHQWDWNEPPKPPDIHGLFLFNEGTVPRYALTQGEWVAVYAAQAILYSSTDGVVNSLDHDGSSADIKRVVQKLLGTNDRTGYR
jgi:hypothetical protein